MKNDEWIVTEIDGTHNHIDGNKNQNAKSDCTRMFKNLNIVNLSLKLI
jgi:hypothetical protein